MIRPCPTMAGCVARWRAVSWCGATRLAAAGHDQLRHEWWRGNSNFYRLETSMEGLPIHGCASTLRSVCDRTFRDSVHEHGTHVCPRYWPHRRLTRTMSSCGVTQKLPTRDVISRPRVSGDSTFVPDVSTRWTSRRVLRKEFFENACNTHAVGQRARIGEREVTIMDAHEDCGDRAVVRSLILKLSNGGSL